MNTDDGQTAQANKNASTATAVKTPRKTVPTMQTQHAHELLGHPSERTTRSTMQFYNVKLVGNMEVCEVPYARGRDIGVHKSSENGIIRLVICLQIRSRILFISGRI